VGAFYHQTQPPCRQRRYTVAVAAPFALTLRSHHGAAAPAESEVGEYRVYRWELHDVPGIEWDAWTPPARDFVPWSDFSSLPAWEPLVAHYRKELMPREAVALEEQARRLTRGADTPRDKAAALYEYAARQVHYGRPAQEKFDPTSRPLSRMAEDLRGDCKDKSALLVGLLSEAGIPAHIALINTRPQGTTPFLPSPRFDHALVLADVEGQPMWLDAAAGPYTFGDVPFNDQGTHALILDAEAPRYVEVPSAGPEQHTAHYVCTGRLDEAGDHRFRAQATFRGDRAAQLRQALLDRSEEFRAHHVRHVVGGCLPGSEVGAVEIRADDLKTDLGYSCEVILPHRARRVERLLLFRIPWVEPVTSEGPLAASERRFPLSTPLVQSTTEEHEIELPPGFGGYGLPVEHEQRCAWGSYRCSVRVEEGRLRCWRRLEVHGGIVAPERFADVKRFYAACRRSDEADVVLVQEHL
jgi:hypothetical protein